MALVLVYETMYSRNLKYFILMNKSFQPETCKAIREGKFHSTHYRESKGMKAMLIIVAVECVTR